MDEIVRYVEKCYLEVLKRPADPLGRENYVRLIEGGKIKREDLANILKSSAEYMELQRKNKPSPVVEHLVPERVKMEFYRKWDALLGIANKVESGGKGVDEAPREGFVPYVETFVKYAPPEKYPQILDIGAGCGAETSVLKEKGYKVTGITLGKDNIKYAKEKFGIDLIEMDFHNLEFPNGCFDGVFMIQTFEHCFAPWLFIIELRRVLHDGGRVFLDVPDPNDEAMLRTIWHTSVLYPNQIKALFWKAGFKEVADLSKKHRLGFFFEKLPDNSFEMWGYVRFLTVKGN